MAMDQNIDLVKRGYNQIAKTYSQHRVSLHAEKYLYQLLKMLKKQATILDLGCGNGLPVDSILIKNDFLLFGIDISPVQIAMAQKNLPQGSFVVKNMLDLKDGEYQVDAVVSFYALFHIPKVRHLEMLKKINSFLPNKGWLLITMGDRDFEGEHQLLGTKMWSSQFGVEKNRQLIKQAGFEIILDKIDHSGKERHQIIIAQKSGI